jgi:multidrug resistance protein MdtO
MNTVQPRLQEYVPWYELIRQELLPYHGRMAGSLRTTLAACIALTAMMTFRTPAVAPGVYLIFLISYETPYLSFTSSVFSLVFQCIGVASTLLLVIVTDNSPVARVLGTALFSFTAAFLLKTMRRRGAIDFGVFTLTTLELWDMKLPANQLVELSMWPVATGAMGVLIAVGIEYAFAHRDPFYALHREFEARMQTLESFFIAYIRPQNILRLQAASRELVRFSFAGQGKMESLLEEISRRQEGSAAYVDVYPIMLTHLFRLLDVAANFSLQKPESLNAAERARLLRLVRACAAIRHAPLQVRKLASCLAVSSDDAPDDLIGQMERIVTQILELNVGEKISWQRKERGQKSAPAWFAPDMWSNPDYWDFSLRISICSTLCYIIYSALDWPGISTAVLTVLIVGLNTSGAMSQKLIFRFIGAALGCIVLGLGSIVFLFPHMDSIASLIFVVAGVNFAASWLARSPHIAYIGMQIIFSFYLITFEGFSALASMTPARDRMLGIALALLVVWIAFLEIAPVRTPDEMRKSLARALKALADYVRLGGMDTPPSDAECVRLRRVITRQMIGIRNMDEMLPYEIGTRRRRNRFLGNLTMQAALSATDLLMAFIHVNATSPTSVPYGQTARAYTSLADELADCAARLQPARKTMQSMEDLAVSAENKRELPAELQESYNVFRAKLTAMLAAEAS